MKISIKRLNAAYHFQAVNETGNTIDMDGSADIGGQNLGMRPMQLLLAALGGCSSIDVVLILNKQRQVITDYDVTVTGEREPDVVPALFKKIHLHFMLSGENLDPEKVKRAIDLSMEKYCSVAFTLAPTATITTDFSIHPPK